MDFWEFANTDLPNNTSDWDILCPTVESAAIVRLEKKYPEYRVEFHDMDMLNNARIYDHYCNQYTVPISTPLGPMFVAPMTLLYLLKRSHAWRDRSFEKTMYDLWKRELYLEEDCLSDIERDLLKERTELSYKRFPQRTPKLNKSVTAFFDDPVDKYFDHDWLHEVFAYEDKPMFTRLQPDPESAWCAEDLWKKLTYEQRLQCVAEECSVIATERFVVPKNWVFPTRLAYIWALRKVCTTLCSGWFRDFAIDNYGHVLDLFSQDRFNEIYARIRTADLYKTARYHNNG